MKITFEPIGIIHSPFTDLADMPIQPTGEKAAEGTLEIYPAFRDALADLEGFSHIYALYFFHKVNGWQPKVVPFLDKQPRGLFSTRAPRRPNPIGLSLLKILAVEGGSVRVAGVDILDGTPLLDIKPYIPGFENPQDVHIGWLEGRAAEVKKRESDRRFED
jgi:tRNA-Thr(GGU) m(6)t(6)A37 methyltransferase TsaA